MTPIVTQVLTKKKIKATRGLVTVNAKPISEEEKLYYKDIAGFIIFLVVVFCVLVISIYA